jgi:hypothetical protein
LLNRFFKNRFLNNYWQYYRHIKFVGIFQRVGKILLQISLFNHYRIAYGISVGYMVNSRGKYQQNEEGKFF